MVLQGIHFAIVYFGFPISCARDAKAPAAYEGPLFGAFFHSITSSARSKDDRCVQL
jgi:hypothetical protein